MSMASSSSIVVAHNSAVFSGTRSQALSWNPISRLAVSKRKSDELSFWAAKKTVLRHTTRSWILGLVVSFILPFFTNKWGPLWVIKNKLENAVQTVENIVEAVEKVADSVDKIAEDIADDLPEGSKLRDLVEKVESLAEKTAKTADSLDDVIDKVQEAGDHVDDIVCATKAESDLLQQKKNS
ncbi:hypothetical protein SASPL_100837 [Salvia splendens]|uniref:Uncharacterized protein n=1 Tax=Salvia splendens TaxID=180675 RepID=A0A8X9ACU8_SALSN|nr:hypothetical protein SASPL_100837 [Salvia splendens]